MAEIKICQIINVSLIKSMIILVAVNDASDSFIDQPSEQSNTIIGADGSIHGLNPNTLAH